MTPDAPKPVPTEPVSKGPAGAFHMPGTFSIFFFETMKINLKSLGLSNINMNSLKKKQKQISGGSVPPSEEKIAEEPKVPEWKKNLISRNRTTKSFVQKNPTGKPGK